MPRQEKQETVGVVDGQGTTALMRAAKAGDEHRMYALLQAGAQANAVDHLGKTPLMYVADGDMRDGSALVALLLSFGADIDAVDHFGNCAVMRAALVGNWTMVRVLQAQGADMRLANCYGTTPDDVWRFMCQDSDSDPDSYPEDAPSLAIPGKPLPASAFEPAGAEGDTGYCWQASDDLLNQAFDASMLDPMAADMQHTPGAQPLGTHFESL